MKRFLKQGTTIRGQKPAQLWKRKMYQSMSNSLKLVSTCLNVLICTMEAEIGTAQANFLKMIQFARSKRYINQANTFQERSEVTVNVESLRWREGAIKNTIFTILIIIAITRKKDGTRVNKSF